MSLAKVSRKLRRKMKMGRIGFFGVEQTAKDVVGQWRVKRDTEGKVWVSEYERGIKEADTKAMETNLTLWYDILSREVAPKLRETIPKIYAEVVGKYRQQKKVKIPVVAK